MSSIASLANSFDQMRKAGAVARAMLVNAAAQRWKVAESDITVSGGRIGAPPTTPARSFAVQAFGRGTRAPV